ncbi:MAG TPA: hypothetical protein VNR87_02610 [Flavisolibacter sp.]|nr:hypothetical protein [Flavisolibacter sp.]
MQENLRSIGGFLNIRIKIQNDNFKLFLLQRRSAVDGYVLPVPGALCA